MKIKIKQKTPPCGLLCLMLNDSQKCHKKILYVGR